MEQELAFENTVSRVTFPALLGELATVRWFLVKRVNSLKREIEDS